MSFSERRARMRAYINGPGCIFPASVADPIAARIAEDIGFEAGMLCPNLLSKHAASAAQPPCPSAPMPTTAMAMH